MNVLQKHYVRIQACSTFGLIWLLSFYNSVSWRTITLSVRLNCRPRFRLYSRRRWTPSSGQPSSSRRTWGRSNSGNAITTRNELITPTQDSRLTLTGIPVRTTTTWTRSSTSTWRDLCSPVLPATSCSAGGVSCPKGTALSWLLTTSTAWSTSLSWRTGLWHFRYNLFKYSRLDHNGFNINARKKCFFYEVN